MTWIGRYSAGRRKLVDPNADPGVDRTKQPPVELSRDTFVHLLVKGDVTDRHGAFLEPSAEAMDAIAGMAQSMEPFRANQFKRTLTTFYDRLGKTLSKTPAKDRANVARAAINAMRALIEGVGVNERLMPSIATLTSLLEPRGVGGVEQLTKNAPEALKTLVDLTATQEGRANGHTSLHLYRNLVEVLEGRTKNLAAEDRPALWREVSAFVDRASPISGTDQTIAADLNAWVLDALAGGADWRGALAQAEAKAFERFDPHRQATLEQVKVSAEGVAAGTPGRTANDLLKGALIDLLQQNKAGDDTLYDKVQAFAIQAAQNAGRITDQNLPLVRDMAKIIGMTARNPGAANVIELFTTKLSNMLQKCPPDLLTDVANGKDASKIASGLIDVAATVGNRDRAQLEEAKQTLDRLPPGPSARAAAAFLPYVAQANIAPALAKALATKARHANDQEELNRFAQQFVALFPTLQQQLGADAGPVAAELAGGYGAAIPAKEIQKVGTLALAVKAAMPDVPLEALVGRDGDGRPGLSDLRKDLRHDPAPLLTQLLDAVKGMQLQPRDRLELVRRAMHLAGEAAMVDREIDQAFPRMLEDWRTGFGEPNKLAFAKQAGGPIAVRAGNDRDGLSFLRRHDALPPELAMTAGLHLEARQLAWLHDKLEGFRSHGHTRILRDAVFAAVELDRLDLLDALAGPKVDGKTMLATAELLATELRDGRIQNLPADQIIEALKNGRDPAAVLQDQGGVEVAGLDGVKATAAGAEILERFKPDLDALLNKMPPGQKVYSSTGENWRTPLLEVMKAVAEGRWPDASFEGDVAQRQLEGLSQEQVAIWKRDDITGTPDPAQAKRPEVQHAFKLLDGIRKALPQALEMEWTQETLDALSKERAEHIAGVRNNEKGSEAHRTHQAALGPLSDQVALLELKLALDRTLGENPPDAATALLQVKARLPSAERAAKRLGGAGFAEAISEVKAVAATIQSSPRDGRHAIDDNSLEAYLKSFDTGCLRANGGSNAVSLVEHIASPMYKMARAFNGSTGEARGFARLYRGTFPGYDGGHVIQLDILRPISRAAATGPEAKKILHEHFIDKATEMGLPYLTSDAEAVQIAKARGYRVLENQAVTLGVDHGHTGLHHAQNIETRTYWVYWKHAHNYPSLPAQADGVTTAEVQYTKHVILPPGVAEGQ